MHNFLNKCKKPAAIHYLLYHISTPNATVLYRPYAKEIQLLSRGISSKSVFYQDAHQFIIALKE